MTIDLEAKLAEIEKWREDIAASRAQRELRQESHLVELEKWREDIAQSRLEQRYLPKDHTLRAAAIGATFATGLIAGTAAIVVAIIQHH